ncbi:MULTISPECIES: RICIN domain-containing protein [unclassified Streptomyces]|uniref:RICIN domain-containing protein n=1 Tax=unclassified Streptomyces TaxID=2593676 RepID=UPI0031BB0637
MDRVVRVLATACDRENRGVPVAHVVVVGPDTVWLRLKTPDERPPVGWTADHGGRTWHARLRMLQSASVAESLPDPYPKLVSLGDTASGFALLNLSQVGGIISLEGDARQARALAEAWTRELTTSPWSQGVQVVRIGFRPGTAERFGSAESPTQALTDGDAALDDVSGGVALLVGLPGGRDRQRERITKLADDPDGRWSVVVVGRVDQPRWRFTIDANGVVDTGLLDEPVARRLHPSSDAPAHEEAGADPAGHPVGGAAPENRRRGGPFTRRWVIVATAVGACLMGTALVLTLKDSSSSSAPGAKASGTQGAPQDAATSKPTARTPPANAAPASGGTTNGGNAGTATALVNPGTGKCLSGSKASDGTPLILAACDGSANQKWDPSNGTVRTKGLCMDAAWGATAPGTVVQLANCSGNPAQRFSVRAGNSTVYSEQAKLCVGTVNGGTAIQLLPCGHNKAEAVFKRG